LPRLGDCVTMLEASAAATTGEGGADRSGALANEEPATRLSMGVEECANACAEKGADETIPERTKERSFHSITSHRRSVARRRHPSPPAEHRSGPADRGRFVDSASRWGNPTAARTADCRNNRHCGPSSRGDRGLKDRRSIHIECSLHRVASSVSRRREPRGAPPKHAVPEGSFQHPVG